jgi:hypothetical protein
LRDQGMNDAPQYFVVCVSFVSIAAGQVQEDRRDQRDRFCPAIHPVRFSIVVLPSVRTALSGTSNRCRAGFA